MPIVWFIQENLDAFFGELYDFVARLPEAFLSEGDHESERKPGSMCWLLRSDMCILLKHCFVKGTGCHVLQQNCDGCWQAVVRGSEEG